MALQETLEKAGFKCFGAGPEKEYSEDLAAHLCDTKISAVVTSVDRNFNYTKIIRATNYPRDTDIIFISTNEDICDPGPIPGLIYSAAGCMSSCISKMSGRYPIVMGKPNKPTFDYLVSKFGIDPKKAIMIGDRCDTDIVFGNTNGMDTILTLTGICQIKDVEKFKSEGKMDYVPKFYTPRLGSFFKMTENESLQGC